MGKREEMLEEVEPVLKACREEAGARSSWEAARNEIAELESWIADASGAAPEPYQQPSSSMLKAFAGTTGVATILAFLLVNFVFGSTVGLIAAVIVLVLGVFVLVRPAISEYRSAVEVARSRAGIAANDYQRKQDLLPSKKADLERAKAEAEKYHRLMGEAQEAKRNDIFTPEQTELGYVSLVRQVVYDGEADSWKEAKQVANTRLHQERLEREAAQQTQASQKAAAEQARSAEYQKQRAREAEWQSDQLERLMNEREEFYKALNDR